MSQTKVVTGKVRFSYANVWTPTSIEEGGTKKYNVSIMIPKTDTATVDKIKAAVDAACADFKSKNNGKLPKNYKLPLRDGDEEREDDENYAGHYFVNASSLKQPLILDKDKEEILDKDEFYSGCYGRAVINFYAFDKAGNKGVAAGLNSVMKLKDGEPLGGNAASADDYEDDFEDDDLMG